MRRALASPRSAGQTVQNAGWLGITLDTAANSAGGPRISSTASRVPAYVIPTNEELIIARHTRRLILDS